MPVLDAGHDEESGSYFIVMPQAEKSLQQEIERTGVFTDKEATSILHAIAMGLAEVQKIVHRDLKPGNVLYHEELWKVADFGIARFVEDSTSLQTLKGCLSPPYAAPEQWRMERASSATDIYALGCIAYALLTGSPPFNGPSVQDYREQHLHAEPPPLAESRPRLRTLVTMMLQKTPQSRPSLERVIRILEDIGTADTSQWGAGLQALSQAGVSAAEAAIREEAIQQEREAKQQARENLAQEAIQILHNTIKGLFARILEVAPTAKRTGSWNRRLRVELDRASLEVKVLNGGRAIPESAFHQSGWDVIAGATICVNQGESTPIYRWGANLWYTDLGQGNEYRWWEVPYFAVGPRLSQYYENYKPFALDVAVDFRDADLAASHVMNSISIAAKPTPIDSEYFDDFCDRWADLLAEAYRGELRNPSSLPLSR
jgi:serine/threonine-protein kinase